MYKITYNGKTNESIGIYATRPNIPAPKRKANAYTIPGRDGDLYDTQDAVEDVEITVKMGFYGSPLQWGAKFRAARNWLLMSTRGELVMEDDPDVFYKVKNVILEDGEREVKNIGEFEAVFVCEGCQYIKAGKNEYSIGSVTNNPYWICHPTYKITGNGNCQLTVNGKTMRANVSSNITIDTERKMAYNNAGASQNTLLTGNYEDLYLKNGQNTITASSGFTVRVIPNWRSL